MGALRVRRLDDRLIDKIAAGEVVERPASVVKELVENALDAGATAIEIAVEGGGAALIRVADDGHGIAAADLPLAVERHCTSKLSDAAGLAAIATMGFRGEALPSIGAVARLSVTSRTAGAEAFAIAVEGGRIAAVAPAARAEGTTVEVRDLFFATPARLKFMKSERAEAMAVSDTVRRLALSAPGVAFTWTLGGRTTRWPASDWPGRCRAILGAEFADEALELEAGRGAATLSGLLGLPSAGRASSAHAYAFVNGRVVRDRLIMQALRAGYSDVMARDRHPVALMRVACDPADVDVNVHPQKADVRFRDAEGMRGLIVSAVRRRLAEAAPRTSRALSLAAIAALSPVRRADPLLEDPHAGFAEPPRTFAAAPILAPRAAPGGAGEAAQAATVAERHPLGAAVAQVHGNYVIAATAGGIVIVDQHAAHERIVYEALKASAAARVPAAQGLLIPAVVELPADAVDALAAHADVFARLGLSLEPFGPGAVVVRATPAALGRFDVARLVRDLADEVAEFGGSEAVALRLDRVAASMACHGSVRSGRVLRREEMDALLRQIESTPSAAQCNHGRPTFVALSLVDIEKLFERR